MIYFFHGSDTEKVRRKAFEWITKARAKEPNLAYTRLVREEVTDATLEEAASSSGLFVQRLLILIDDPFPTVRTEREAEDGGTEEAPKSGPFIEKHLDALAASDNAIIILAPGLAPAIVKKIATRAKTEYTFDVSRPHGETVRGFNAGLVDALAARSRERLWLEVNHALFVGDAPEMLHGLLHWKARDLMKKGNRVWSSAEARRLSLTLIKLLQSSRRGGLSLALSLERFALSI
jgi:hypothetical protein